VDTCAALHCNSLPSHSAGAPHPTVAGHAAVRPGASIREGWGASWGAQFWGDDIFCDVRTTRDARASQRERALQVRPHAARLEFVRRYDDRLRKCNLSAQRTAAPAAAPPAVSMAAPMTAPMATPAPKRHASPRPCTALPARARRATRMRRPARFGNLRGRVQAPAGAENVSGASFDALSLQDTTGETALPLKTMDASARSRATRPRTLRSRCPRQLACGRPTSSCWTTLRCYMPTLTACARSSALGCARSLVGLMRVCGAFARHCGAA
jgi:hypothetical protein